MLPPRVPKRAAPAGKVVEDAIFRESQHAVDFSNSGRPKVIETTHFTPTEHLTLVSRFPRLPSTVYDLPNPLLVTSKAPTRPNVTGGADEVAFLRRAHRFCIRGMSRPEALYKGVESRDRRMDSEGERAVWLTWGVEESSRSHEEKRSRWNAVKSIEGAMSEVVEVCMWGLGEDGPGNGWEDLGAEVEEAMERLEEEKNLLESWMNKVRKEEKKKDDAFRMRGFDATQSQGAVHPGMDWPYDPQSVRAQLQAVLDCYHSSLESDDKWHQYQFPPEGYALDAFIQLALGGYRQLDDFEPTRFIQAASILGASIDILDGKEPRELGVLKSMCVNSPNGLAPVSVLWLQQQSRDISKKALSEFQSGWWSGRVITPVKFSAQPATVDGDFNGMRRMVVDRLNDSYQSERFEIYKSKPVEGGLSDDVATAIAADIAQFSLEAGKVKLELVIDLVERMEQRGADVVETSFSAHLLFDNILLLRRLRNLSDASITTDPAIEKHISTIVVLLSMALLSSRPDLYAIVFSSYVFQTRLSFFRTPPSDAMFNNRLQLEMFELAASSFISTLSFHSYKRTGRVNGRFALVSDCGYSCDSACGRPVVVSEGQQDRDRASSRARISRSGAKLWRNLGHDRAWKYPCPDCLLDHGDVASVRVLACLTRRLVHRGCRAGQGRAGWGSGD